jgi:hypothetical protein
VDERLGSGEADTHALSVTFALLTVPPRGWARPRAFGDRAAWIAACWRRSIPS